MVIINIAIGSFKRFIQECNTTKISSRLIRILIFAELNSDNMPVKVDHRLEVDRRRKKS